MKKILTLASLLFSLASFSQNSKRTVFQFWNSEGKMITEENDALYFTVIQKVNDTCWHFESYKNMGPMLSSEQYRDRDGKILHGRSSFMRPDGTLDSTGNFVSGKTNGTWLYFNTNGFIATTKEYVMGELISSRIVEANAGTEGSSENMPDTEARFPKEQRDWLMYLIKNLRYPSYASSRKIQGRVRIRFVVDEKGRVRDEMLLKSAEFSLDTEAMRLIRESPRWTAATKNGQKIKSFVHQGIQFRTE